jgi:hypothetical protein
MNVIPNKWVEKVRKKRGTETAAAYASNNEDSWLPVNPNTKIKRFSSATCAAWAKTLRGLRK